MGWERRGRGGTGVGRRGRERRGERMKGRGGNIKSQDLGEI